MRLAAWRAGLVPAATFTAAVWGTTDLVRHWAKWAIDLVTWSNNCWEAKVSVTASGESYTEKDSFKIERIINNPQKYVNQSGNSGNQRIALQHGFTPGSVITRNTRGLDPKRRSQIIDDLHEAGLIASSEQYNQVVYHPLVVS